MYTSTSLPSYMYTSGNTLIKHMCGLSSAEHTSTSLPNVHVPIKAVLSKQAECTCTNLRQISGNTTCVFQVDTITNTAGHKTHEECLSS